MFSSDFNYFWSRISLKFSRVDIKTSCQMLLGNVSLHLYIVCTRTLQCKIQNFKRPSTVWGLLYPAGSVSSAEGSGEKRGREVDVVLHSLLMCLVCILMLLFRLFFSFIFHFLYLSGQSKSNRGREATVATYARPKFSTFLLLSPC